jgi:GrpB-like predicted nucleotidyltransferase (UPF0157 family)
MKTSVQVVAYNPEWPKRFEAEQKVLLTHSTFIALEHIGSTAIPNQRAKPIIDMMASMPSLYDIDSLLEFLSQHGYKLFEMGMKNRLFFRKPDQSLQVFHLHIVEESSWSERKERHMRDYLLQHPEAVTAYGELKDKLAITYADDSLGYTEAKTAFIQGISDKIQDARGLPRFKVWED